MHNSEKRLRVRHISGQYLSQRAEKEEGGAPHVHFVKFEVSSLRFLIPSPELIQHKRAVQAELMNVNGFVPDEHEKLQRFILNWKCLAPHKFLTDPTIKVSCGHAKADDSSQHADPSDDGVPAVLLIEKHLVDNRKKGDRR